VLSSIVIAVGSRTILFAAGNRTLHSLLDQAWWPVAALGVVLIVAGIVFSAIRAWLSDNSAGEESGSNLLDELREMRSRGELTEEEYRRIKSRLVTKRSTGTNPSPAPSTSNKDAFSQAESTDSSVEKARVNLSDDAPRNSAEPVS
jgi:membrane protein required for beta-lactamase induction